MRKQHLRPCVLLVLAMGLGACDPADLSAPRLPAASDPKLRLFDGGPPRGAAADGAADAGAIDAGGTARTDSGAAGGCGSVDYLGLCEGTVARWCKDGRVEARDCAAERLECGWVSDALGYYCGTGVAGRRRPGAAGDGGTDAGSAADPTAAGCGRPLEMEELNLTNAARMRNGLSALRCDDALTRSARLHSKDMCERRYFSHVSLDGRSHVDRMQAAGAVLTSGGENIAYGQPTPASVHDTWMNSSGHHRNIMSSGWSRIGVGHHDCGGTQYWTQNFAD